MIREEEDDMTQEMRQFVVFSIDNEIKTVVDNIFKRLWLCEN